MISAWFAHLFTASGIVCVFLATTRIFEHDYREAFFWLGLQVVIDGVDGALARRAKVKDVLPWFDGAKMDDIIDYAAYVFVPMLFVWRALLVPDTWIWPIVISVLLASLYRFNSANAKTADHFFTGFPSYWNLVVFYMFMTGWSPEVNGAILIALVVLVFVPIRYVYPSRTPTLAPLTNILAALWALLLFWMLWLHPNVPGWLLLLSYFFPVYYVGLSLVLQASRPRPSA